MASMLGRFGAWFYGRPCGRTSRFMRKSGRQRERQETRREAAQEGYDWQVCSVCAYGVTGPCTCRWGR